MNIHYLSRIFSSFLLILLTGATLATAESDKPVVFKARTYGVLPDMKGDAGPGLRKALFIAGKSGAPAVVQLEAGTYRIDPGESPESALVIQSMREVTLRGKGAKTKIIFTNPRMGGFFVAESEEVWLENLSIDYDPVPFTQGTVLLVNRKEGSFDLALEEGYPSLAAPWFAEAPKPYGQWGMIFDAKERRLKAGAPDFIFMDHWAPVSGRVWRLFPVADQRDRLAKMAIGDRFVHMARHGKGGAAFFWRCQGGGLRNVTIHASQSLAVGIVSGKEVTVDGVNITWPTGSDRLLTTNADGVHCQQNIIGPHILNCTLEGMADDAVNIYHLPNLIREVISETVIRAAGGNEIALGDRLQIFDPTQGIVRGEADVAAVMGDPAAGYRIVLAAPIAGMRAGADKSNADSVYNLSRCGAGFEIRGNIFRNHRRHGMMIKAPGGLIENNLLDGEGGLGIIIGNDPDWPEALAPWDITVRGNTIRNIGRSMWYGADPRGAAIQVMSRAAGGIAQQRLVHDIVLEDNQCLNPPGAALYIGSARRISVDGFNAAYTAEATPQRTAAAIIIENAGAVTLNDIDIRSKHPETSAMIEIGDSVDAGEAGMTCGVLRGGVAPGSPAIRDQRASSMVTKDKK